MPNLSSMLERAEHAVSSVPLPTGGLERLRNLRDRKRRNQRIAAGAVGIAVFVTALWIVLTGGPFDRSVTPGGGGGVTGPMISEPAIPQGAAGAGLIGLPPEGAIPSTPTTGELVLSFMSGRTMGDAERFNAFLYADGRLIWTQLTDPSPGLIEQRLTPEGVELLRSEVLSTGLFDHDRNLLAAPGLYFGQIQVRDGDRLVSVIWGDCCDPVTSSAAKETPTLEQARALQRLDVRVEDPATWLPASAWEDPEMKPYVPTRYSVCVNADDGFGLDRVLGSLPQDAEDLLRSWDRTLEVVDHTVGPDLDVWCSDVTTEEARPLAAILDEANLEHRDLGSQPVYVPESLGTAEVSIGFFAQLPHEVA